MNELSDADLLQANIFSSRMILVPANIKEIGHWVLIVVDPRAYVIRLYDSSSSGKRPPEFVEVVKAYMSDEWRRLNGGPLPHDWNIECVADISRQRNGYDCGTQCSFPR